MSVPVSKQTSPESRNNSRPGSPTTGPEESRCRAGSNRLSVAGGGGVEAGPCGVFSGHIRSESPAEEQRRRLQTRRFTGSSSEKKKFCCLNRTGRGVLPRTCISHGCSFERNPPRGGLSGPGPGVRRCRSDLGCPAAERLEIGNGGGSVWWVAAACHHHNNQVPVSTMPAE